MSDRMKHHSSKSIGIVLAITGSLFWGASGVIAQFLMTTKQVETSWLVGVRIFFAGVIMIIIASLKYKKDVLAPIKNKKELLTLFIFSLFGVNALQFSFFKAIATSNAATATILQYLSPIFLVVFFIIESKKIPSKLTIISILLSLLGIVLLVTGGDISTLSISTEGLIWGLLAGFFGAFYIVQPRALLKKYGTLLVIGWGMLMGGGMLQIFYPFWHAAPKMDAATLSGVLFIVIFGTILSYMCLLKSTNYIPAQYASLLTSFEPLSSAVLSVLFLGVSLSKVELTSIAVIILAVFLLSRAEDL